MDRAPGDKNDPKPDQATYSKEATSASRAEREALALRDNLRRRKEQARARQSSGDAEEG